MPKTINLTGMRFGRWYVVEYAGPNNQQQSSWLCECDCGTTKVVSGRDLRDGDTKSCGCYKRERSLSINRLADGESAINAVYGHYKKGAVLRGLEFSLSKEEFCLMTQQVCHYCGVAPSNTRKTQRPTGVYIYNGIDRIDNTKGYVSGNMVSCCFKCNLSKKEMSYQQFLEWVGRVYFHSVEREG